MKPSATSVWGLQLLVCLVVAGDEWRDELVELRVLVRAYLLEVPPRAHTYLSNFCIFLINTRGELANLLEVPPACQQLRKACQQLVNHASS
jgi:hypothetical protein